MKTYSFGPSGGPGGHVVDGVIPDGAQIVRFDVKWGQWINYFGIRWTSSTGGEGVIMLGDVNGGDNSIEHPLGPGEYVTAVSGTYDRYVNSLIVTTNRGTYQAGNAAGAAFEYQWPGDVLRARGPRWARRRGPGRSVRGRVRGQPGSEEAVTMAPRPRIARAGRP
ncbi:MAG: jacalin-like lectin [Minicystis sp.]